MGLVERIRSDAIYFSATVRLFRRLMPLLRSDRHTVFDLVEAAARRHGARPALIQDDRTLSYRDVDEGANRYARWARAAGIGKGEVVALLTHNRPEQVMAWIGIARAGAATALLGTEQVGPSLAHSISIVAPRHLIAEAELAGSLASARPHVDRFPKVWATNGAIADAEDLDTALAAQDGGALADAERTVATSADPCLYIYTSGTTGQPKAAKITHYRALAAIHAFAAGMRTTRDDRVYTPLPLAHGTATLAGVGATLSVGAAAILKRRFSAREFWSDCVRHDATVFVYIGELCRYLANCPPSPDERRHRLRLACGNGLRADVWERFQSRFRVARILEFYASTEGNVALANHDGRIGSIGRIPFWMRPLSNVEIVRFDMESEMPVRGADGRCLRCRAGEVGEAIGRIEINPAKPIGRFDGYADPKATERKILRDVFAQGDRWFRTGDLMRHDEDGYFYFVDRTGDTFRWKGENVATFEVANVLSRFPGIDDVNVYGVEVPMHDGRAGMAAVVSADGKLDLQALADHLSATLPDYARPVFLRIAPEIEVTSTLKHRKTTLKQEGFDPSTITDALYYSDPRTRAYRPLHQGVFEQIRKGEIRF